LSHFALLSLVTQAIYDLPFTLYVSSSAALNFCFVLHLLCLLMFSTERTQAKPQLEKSVMNKDLDRGWKEEARNILTF